MGWRYTVGRKGVNRVTVYERDRGTSIYVLWHDDLGRHRKSLATVLGHPVTDREIAIEAANRMAIAQKRKRNQQAAQALGLPTKRTLGELFERRHSDLRVKWSEKYAKSRELRRAFWLTALGEECRLEAVSPAVVEMVAREAQGSKSDRWRQDVLRYLVDSFGYARRKLKWIGEAHDLSAVDVPAAKGESKPYTLAEARKLLPALWDVHPVAGWIGEVAAQTGRRLTAIRKLRPTDVLEMDGCTVIQFPASTDKVRNSGQAVVDGLRARTDWTMPSQELCNAWIHEAEQRAGIQHQQGRAWHGLKRLYATLVAGEPGADKQSGTLASTLETHYRGDLLAPKVALAKRLRGELCGS